MCHQMETQAIGRDLQYVAREEFPGELAVRLEKNGDGDGRPHVLVHFLRRRFLGAEFARVGSCIWVWVESATLLVPSVIF